MSEERKITVKLDNTVHSLIENGEEVGDPGPTLEVLISGMGTCCTPDAAPIYLEFYEGKWVLHVWSDINKEDPTHRNEMDGAFENRRDNELPR